MLSELANTVERLNKDMEIATNSIEALQAEAASFEKEKKEVAEKLKEAMEETNKTEELLAIAEAKYEQTEKAYRIALEKKITVSRTPATSTIAPADLA